MYIEKLLVVVIVAIKLETSVAQGDDSPIIVTEAGPVVGRKDYTVGQNKPYYAFQGIPYAEPPVGNLRFSAPVKKSNWQDVLDATQDKSECVQGSDPVTGGEDCLFINVYTPSLTTTNLSVAVYIHGGGFTGGNSSYVSNGPDYFLDEGIIFVLYNYRLGIFGFVSTEDLVCPGNWGLKDQVLALEWVRDNIAYFGGNPSNVTIFGESAGAASVSYLLQTNKTQGLFSGAIMNSGTSLSLWALNRRAKETAFAVGAALGIVTISSSDLISALRNVSCTDLQTASNSASSLITLENVLRGILYGPVIEQVHDDALFVNKSEDLLSKGGFHKVPTIVGFTSNEAAGVGTITDLMRAYFLQYDVAAEKLAPIDLSPNVLTRKIAGTVIKLHYFGLLPISLSTDQVIQFVSDDQFNRPIRQTVIEQSKYTPVYCYMFSYEGALGGIQNRTLQGAGHAEDLSYLFRRYSSNVSTADASIRSIMVRFWTNFIKYSNPTPTQDSLLQNITWQVAGSDPLNLNYLNIDTNLQLLQNPFEESMEFYDNIYAQFGHPPYDTY